MRTGSPMIDVGVVRTAVVGCAEWDGCVVLVFGISISCEG